MKITHLELHTYKIIGQEDVEEMRIIHVGLQTH